MSTPTIIIELPEALRPLADGQSSVEVTAATVAEALDALGQIHPQARLRILTRGGELRPHVHLFVRATDIRAEQGLATALHDGDTLLVVPSVAGG
ncbi:MAG: MoaD/ThiS family protein [Wenzhouxiangellaceae bacterium]|nr:MoaD/ThiS family protein [Wenzhouxiangellaceae bacterium]